MKMLTTRVLPLLTAVVVIFFTQMDLFAQGIFFRGIGAVNESMGGASIAAPIDAAGAIYANPAAISGLKKNEIGFDLGVVFPSSSVTSELLDDWGYPWPSGPVTSQSDSGQMLIPTMSVVYRKHPRSRWVFGCLMSQTGGTSSLYRATLDMPNGDIGNPIFLGKAWSTNSQIYQISPTASFRVSERLSLGVSPVVSFGSFHMTPMLLGRTPDDALAENGSKFSWGGGINLGVFYKLNDAFNLGFTCKSPTWLNPMKYSGVPYDSDFYNMAGVQAEFHFNLPMVLGIGFSYTTPSERLLLACDVKYYDYGNAKGFGTEVMDSDGRITGLGWKSILAVSLGMQYKLSEQLYVRLGYSFNENPIPDESQFANIGTSLFGQHAVSVGASWISYGGLDFHVTYSHLIESSKTGDFAMNYAGWDYPGTVTNTVKSDSVSLGISKRF